MAASFLRASGVGSLACGARQAAAGDEKVGQGEETVELGGVLGQAPVAGLAVPEEVLEDVKRVFHPRELRGPTVEFDPLGRGLADNPFQTTNRPLTMPRFIVAAQPHAAELFRHNEGRPRPGDWMEAARRAGKECGTLFFTVRTFSRKILLDVIGSLF